MDSLEGLKRLAADSLELVGLSLFMVVGLIFFLPGVQSRLAYGAAAIVMGTVFGIIAVRLGLPDGVEIIAVLLGVVCGPPTVAKFQNKTLTEAIAEIRTMRRGFNDDADR